MEFSNVGYITVEGHSFLKRDCTLVPSYEDLKNMRHIIVDDSLKIRQEKQNIDLFTDYIEKKYLLVPIRRISENKQGKNLTFPPRILLEITSKCNLKCVMCPRNVLTRQEIHMPKKLVLKCVDEINHFGVEGLWLYHVGDPLLHPDFKKIFSYCQNKKNLGSIWLSTNGQEISDEIMDIIINSNLTFLNYSLNAMSHESYNMISPKGSYEKLVKNLEKLLDKKNRYKKLGTPPWIRVQMIDQPQVTSEIDLFLQEYSKKCEMLSVNVLEAFNIEQNIGYARKRTREGKKHCKRIQRGDFFIFSDGEVAFCDTDFNHKMSLGSVYKNTIKELWDSDTYARYRDLESAGRLDEIPMCRECLDYDL